MTRNYVAEIAGALALLALPITIFVDMLKSTPPTVTPDSVTACRSVGCTDAGADEPQGTIPQGTMIQTWSTTNGIATGWSVAPPPDPMTWDKYAPDCRGDGSPVIRVGATT